MKRLFSGFLFFMAFVLACSVANADLESHSPWEEARADGKSLTDKAPGAGGIMIRPHLAPERIQAASGELAIVNIDGFTFAKDLSTISFFDLCIRNYRSTSASNVWVEVWASSQIPQIGGNITHFTVATYAFGLVNGYSCQATLKLTPSRQ